MLKRHAYLEKLNEKQRQARFYALHVAPSLFGDWTLVREWGRIGSPGRVRLDWFADEEAAARALDKMERQKIRKGYRALV